MSEQQSSGYKPRCRNLSCKAMQVYGEQFEQDPEYQAGNVDFWCACTARGVGPDGLHVGLELCRERTRDCYREY